MKDSGVQWIGEIPSSWDINRLKFLARISTGDGDTKDKVINGTYPFFVRSQTLEYKDDYTHDEEAILTAGDGAGVGKVFHHYKGKFSAHQRVYILNDFTENINSRFLYYYVQNNLKKVVTLGGAKSTVDSVRLSMLTEFPIAIPKLEEQTQIANKLDDVSNKLNIVISETHQSIEALKEYKESLITEAVTKGLDSSLEMKDSKVDWMGKIPRPWKVIKINQLFSIKKDIANQTRYDVLSVTQKGLRVRDLTKNEGQMAADYSKYQIVETNDFVMNHMDLLTGWVDKANQQGVTSPDYRVFKNKQTDLVFNDFYLYIFQACYFNEIFYGLGQGVSNVGRWRLQTDQFLNFYLPLPPITEQQEIVSYLDEKIKIIDTLIQNKANVLKEAEQYKNSFIYEYVTGKKEV